MADPIYRAPAPMIDEQYEEIAGEPMPDPTPRFAQQPGQSSTCLVPVWDGPYRMRCSMGTKGVCGRHGPHQPHPEDGQPCDPNPRDGYCHTHGVYVRNPSASTPEEG